MRMEKRCHLGSNTLALIVGNSSLASSHRFFASVSTQTLTLSLCGCVQLFAACKVEETTWWAISICARNQICCYVQRFASCEVEQTTWLAITICARKQVPGCQKQCAQPSTGVDMLRLFDKTPALMQHKSKRDTA